MSKDPIPKTTLPAFTWTLRRGRYLFFFVMFLATLAIGWPGYLFFSSPEPFILGFPLSFAWIIFWVLVSFAAMLGLFFSDQKAEREE